MYIQWYLSQASEISYIAQMIRLHWCYLYAIFTLYQKSVLIKFYTDLTAWQYGVGSVEQMQCLNVDICMFTMFTQYLYNTEISAWNKRTIEMFLLREMLLLG